jgi:hypothetical protein
MRIIGILIIAAIALGAFAVFTLLAAGAPASSVIDDRSGDAFAAAVGETGGGIVVQSYHDIVRASVHRLNGNELILSVELSGDPNFNAEYETVYIWVLDYPGMTGNKRYTIIVPHFPPGFASSTGWHIAIFDNNAQRYSVPLKSIGSMPENRVEVNIDPRIIGSPPIFWWQVYVMVRVDQQFEKPPDYLIDSAPDNFNALVWPFV